MKIFFGNIRAISYKYRKDIAVAITLALLFFAGTYQLGKTIPSIILDFSSFDRWYEGDIPRVYENMTWREGNFTRIKVHPLFALATHPFSFLMQKATGMDTETAVRLIVASVAFFWMMAMYTLLRIIGCRRFDSVVLCMLAAASAGSLFWLTVPETFSFGSLSILMALLLVSLPAAPGLHPFWYIFINVSTLAFVVTNWIAGIAATLLNQPVKRAVNIIVYAFAIVTLLWGIQKYIYPSATFFIGEQPDKYNFNFADQKSGGPLCVAGSFFYHTLIMPEIQIYVDPFWDAPTMLTQLSLPGSATPWGLGAVILWTVIMAMGAWALVALKEHKKFRILLGFLIIFQFLMHIVYGSETFLFALHFIAVLVPMVALGLLTKLRRSVLILTMMLIPCVAINNMTQFEKSKQFLRENVKKDPGARDRMYD